MSKLATPQLPPQKEADITRGIRQLLLQLGAVAVKFWGGPCTARGVSDLLVCYQGRFIAIEVKRPGGRVSPEQERFLERVRAAGGIGLVAYGVDDVIDGLEVRDRFLF
jgi:hypothetical protein